MSECSDFAAGRMASVGSSVLDDALRRRLATLALERRAAFALACAERLVVQTGSPRQRELHTAITSGWSALLRAGEDLAAARSEVNDREDLDDDEVAAVAYALEAVLGSEDAAYWAACRALDAAFDRIRYGVEQGQFRPVEADAADPVVQQEFAWQQRAVAAAERVGELPQLMNLLRTE